MTTASEIRREIVLPQIRLHAVTGMPRKSAEKSIGLNDKYYCNINYSIVGWGAIGHTNQAIVISLNNLLNMK